VPLTLLAGFYQRGGMILPGDWGAKPGLEQGLNMEEDEKERVKSLPFELKLTFFSSIVLFYPVVLCLLLGMKPTVLYWCGRWSIFACIAVPIWVMLCHFMFANRLLRPGLGPLAFLILPSVLVFLICEVQVRTLSGQGAVLMSSDCETFQSKAKVEQAWWSAHALLQSCAEELAEKTGSSISETMGLVSIRECRGYKEGFRQHGKEWTYIDSIEKEHHCGGWCSVGPPLFNLQSRVVDSCSVAVAHVVAGNISLLSYQVTSYAAVLLVSVSLVLMYSPSWLPTV